MSPAEALASAQRRAEDHVRELWRERADRALALQRPFWLPEVLAHESVRRWLGNLPVSEILRCVDREDKERMHEFGNSYTTTLWITEEPRQVLQGERQLRRELQRLERTTILKYGGIAAGWVVLAVVLGWLDRLSRGYMTRRLQLLGLAAGVVVPAITFLV
ncbi:MAG TPA: hypothetical protein VFZ65_18585 [Planctomycetota bacterium]|nr:hypothetical protein [Planctomycetota bacterium]